MSRSKSYSMRPSNPKSQHPPSGSDYFVQENEKLQQEKQRARVKEWNQRKPVDIPVESSDEDESEDPEHLHKVSLHILEEYSKADTLEKVSHSTVESPFISSTRQTCIICLEMIGNEDPIWSCNTCGESLHLGCIQSWIQKCGVHPGDETGHWNCPKCRAELPSSEFPTEYQCYCRATIDPEPHMWLPPHSCGETCGKPLSCGHHNCMVLCHPGVCLKCPVVVEKALCYCGKQYKATRCSTSQWSCGEPCAKTLPCGHPCPIMCHEGECPPCGFPVKRYCVCGKVPMRVVCSYPPFSCEKICAKPLNCGGHICGLICHGGECPDCRTQDQTCFCGAEVDIRNCTDRQRSCGGTCNKLLSCGHRCQQRCHPGDCICEQLVKIRCRCKSSGKEVRCGASETEFLCQRKCTRTKNCSRHQCKRKCCDGNCPPCLEKCGRPICRNGHKCQAPCHNSPCYPCSKKSIHSCACGKKKIELPCGQEHSARPLKCKAKCPKPPLCHHASSLSHQCHFGPCPTCEQVCGLELSCGHKCKDKCHDYLLDADELPPLPSYSPNLPVPTFQKIACPPCQVGLCCFEPVTFKEPVKNTCIGKHETRTQPCSEKIFECTKQCTNSLDCGKHRCQKPCHEVTLPRLASGHPVNPPKEGEEVVDKCGECRAVCNFKRECGHICQENCHKGDCDPCMEVVKFPCVCGKVTTDCYCSQTSKADKYCRIPCVKVLSCGHPCNIVCHAKNECNTKCERIVKVRCECRRQKVSVPCHVSTSKRRNELVPCTEACHTKKNKVKIVVEVEPEHPVETVPVEPETKRNKMVNSLRMDCKSFSWMFGLIIVMALVHFYRFRQNESQEPSV